MIDKNGNALMDFVAKDTRPLSTEAIEAAAKTIGCEVPAIAAVSEVESGHSGFTDGKPTMLFESHAFHTQTRGWYDASHPGISTPSWVHNYGAAGAVRRANGHYLSAVNGHVRGYQSQRI